MKCNVAIWDRMVRFVFAVLLSTWAIAGGPSWTYFGFYLLGTAGWGFDPVYSIFKFRTLKFDGPRVPRNEE